MKPTNLQFKVNRLRTRQLAPIEQKNGTQSVIDNKEENSSAKKLVTISQIKQRTQKKSQSTTGFKLKSEKKESIANLNEIKKVQHNSLSMSNMSDFEAGLISKLTHLEHFKDLQQDEVERQLLEARQRRTRMPYPLTEKFNLQLHSNILDTWLGQMLSKVVSTSFNFLEQNKMTFEEAKIYCSENILLNTLLFVQKQAISVLQTAELLKQIDNTLANSLQYLLNKYPQTKQTKPNKAFRAALNAVDNFNDDRYNFVEQSGVIFKPNTDEIYFKQIMKFLNFFLQAQDKIDPNSNTTPFQDFYNIMESIFMEVALDPPETIDYQYILKVKSNIIKQQKQEHWKNIKQYTKYKIGRKIPQQSETYSSYEIQTQNFKVKSAPVLRVLTKWAQQLSRKFHNSKVVFLQRTFGFSKKQSTPPNQLQNKALKNVTIVQANHQNKSQQKEKSEKRIILSQTQIREQKIKQKMERLKTKNFYKKFIMLDAGQKNMLYKEAKFEQKIIQQFEQQMKKSLSLTQSMLIRNIAKSYKQFHIPKYEFYPGYFSSKVQMATSSALLAYLNRLIHSLVIIPQRTGLDINLVTFKIGDLFRCKCKSKEREIVRIYHTIKNLSDYCPHLLKIIRVNDRLEKNTNDVLINVLFQNTFLVEIQLAISSEEGEKLVKLDLFNHFLYELKRSQLGPIMELGYIWAQFDSRSSFFQQKKGSQLQHKGATRNKILSAHRLKHACPEQSLRKYIYPFFCSLCEGFITIDSNLIKNQRCSECQVYFECADCVFSLMTDAEIKKQFGLHEILGPFIDDFQLWKSHEIGPIFEYPRYGLFTSRKFRSIKLDFFQSILFNDKIYLIKVAHDGQLKILSQFENILDGWVEAGRQYILFNWKEKRLVNQFILPQSLNIQMQENIAKEQAKQQLRKQERIKNKQALEAKRAAARNEANSEEDTKKGKKKRKMSESSISQNQDNRKPTEKKNIVTALQAIQEVEIIYNQHIAKCNQDFPFRVSRKMIEGKDLTLVLGPFLKMSQIHQKLLFQESINEMFETCYKSRGTMFFQNKQLDNVQDFLHMSVRCQNMSYQESSAKIQQFWQNLSVMTEAYLNNNNATSINICIYMQKLRVLHICGNNIVSLLTLADLMFLEQIVAEQNIISELPTFKSQFLFQINLDDNCLQYKTYGIPKLKNLQYLKILQFSSNEIPDMTNMQNLCYNQMNKLDLSFNSIPQILKLDSNRLQDLDLSVNLITLMTNIKYFPTLKKLDLSRNLIKQISQEIKQLVSLQILNLSSNQLKTITNFPLLSSLIHLNLSNNVIQVINCLELKSLQILNLSCNMLKDILLQIDLVDTPSLNHFNLSENLIDTVNSHFIESVLHCKNNSFKLILFLNPIENNNNRKLLHRIIPQYCQISNL